MSKSRAIFLFLTIVAVVLVSAVGTTSVYADDGTPPPPATETAAVDPSTEGGEPAATEPAEAAPTSEPVVAEPTSEPAVAAPTSEPAVAEPTGEPVVAEPTEAAAAEEAPVVEEQQPAEPEAEAASILEQVPDNTEVTVLNAAGEAQPLTSQESAEAIATASDPIWCPDDALPGNENCTTPFSSFSALLDFLKQHETEEAYKHPGTIYVEMGNYAGSETSIDFNSYNFTSLNTYNLTVQGGWNTETDEVPDSLDPTITSNFNIPIIVGSSSNPWGGSLTFNNISISDVYNQTGLTLFSGGAIKLNSVSVTGSQAGADLNAGGNVNINKSNFSNNEKFGAKVNSGKVVDIKNSTFNSNTSHKTDGFGLEIDSVGRTSLQAVEANYNEVFGADIQSGGYVKVTDSMFSGNISYTNCVKSCYTQPCKETANGGYGLKVVSTYVPGTDPLSTWAVTLDGVTANGNYLFGAYVEAGDAKILNSNFNENKSSTGKEPLGYGLKVQTTGGKGVTLDGVHADKNQLFGADITAGAFVAVNNSFFDGNVAYYKVCSYQARGCHEVCTETYYGYGLKVVTTDGIALNTVSAQGNHLYGARLEGRSISVFAGTFSGNTSGTSDTLTGSGLKVISSDGLVTLSSVQANNNQLFGADVEAVGNVAITNSFFNGHKVYSYSGNCSAEDMKGCYSQPCVKTLVGGGYGLQVVTTGTISATGIQANDNYLFGARLVGADVAIAGFSDARSTFNNNKEGLKIESTGSVQIDAIEANGNSLSGATIYASGRVVIAGSFFSGNFSYTSSCKGKTFYGSGLQVVTAGNIVISEVTADKNYVSGAYLEGANVTVSDSSFSNNGTGVLSDHVGQGLEIKSTGTISQVNLFNVTANGNQLFGAKIQAEGNVSIEKSFFSGNKSYYRDCSGKTSTGSTSSGGSAIGGSKGCYSNTCKDVYDGYGLKVVTTGNISLNGVKAEDNYLFGAHLEGANVDVSTSTFSSNVSPTQEGQTPTGRGLEVISTGYTSLWKVTASKNQLFGADIQAGGNVDVLSSLFEGNTYSVSNVCKKTTAGYGLKVVATGTIALGSAERTDSGVNANSNGAEGAILNGQSTVAVVDSFFNSNGANGLTITAKDAVTLTNVTAIGNKGNGAEVTGVCTNTVRVTGGEFNDNGKYGLKVVKANYEEGTPAPSFSGNGSGGLFQDSSTCVSGGGTGTGGTGGGNTGGNNGGGHHGWNWYWWWFWSHGFGHHH